tara:strand:- start:189 stop:911 length:723 start_codon:yes stop_codon:yes gene_type:complete
MGRAKDIILKVIPSQVANAFVKKHHYSGKVVPNSKLHFGAFLDGKLHGVMSYGSPMVKKNVIHFVKGTQWNEVIELNRMAFDDYLPKNSESRCISVSIKMIKKNASHIKWILSYSDGNLCGDGTIYRASGFKLIGVNKNTSTYQLPNGEVICSLTSSAHRTKQSGGKSGTQWIKAQGGVKLSGFQLRYIYLIDQKCEITVPVIPFSEIDKKGAGMYKGQKISLQERRDKQSGEVDSNANS